jgi:hypothetical protein
MDNVQNCDCYINIPSSQTYRSDLLEINIKVLIEQLGATMRTVLNWLTTRTNGWLL